MPGSLKTGTTTASRSVTSGPSGGAGDGWRTRGREDSGSVEVGGREGVAGPEVSGLVPLREPGLALGAGTVGPPLGIDPARRGLLDAIIADSTALQETLSKPDFADYAIMGPGFTGGVLGTGIGVGLRWRSPVGPVRLDIAHGLDDPDSSFQLYLNIGTDL